MSLALRLSIGPYRLVGALFILGGSFTPDGVDGLRRSSPGSTCSGSSCGSQQRYEAAQGGPPRVGTVSAGALAPGAFAPSPLNRPKRSAQLRAAERRPGRTA